MLPVNINTPAVVLWNAEVFCCTGQNLEAVHTDLLIICIVYLFMFTAVVFPALLILLI